MANVRRTISLGFTDERVSEGLHICYIYNNESERQAVMAQYLKSGLLDNEKVLCLIDDISQKDMIEELRTLDVREDALTVLESVKGYCPSGVFDPDRTLNLIQAFYHQAVEAEGFVGARGTGQMGWSLDHHLASIENLVEYEARVNDLVEAHPYTACCQYDARQFSGEVIMDVLSVHPMIIIRGQLLNNPYYIPPQTFLAEYRGRS